MATTDPATLRRDLARYSKLLWERGWVANHDGNLTVRLPGGRLLATPTAWSKRLVEEPDILLLDGAGAVLEGRHKVFSEISLHLVALRLREDVGAVVHAHPPTATGLAVAGLTVEPAMIAEAVVSLGDRVPLVRHVLPGDPTLLEAAGEALVRDDVVLLQNHGVLAVGTDLEQAYLRLELVEHLARIALVAREIGAVTCLPRAEVEVLLERRTKAGLGPAARAAARAVAATAPTSPGGRPPSSIAALIAAEVRAALTDDKP